MIALSDAETTYAAAIREAEATHAASTREVEVIHATAVRKAEAVRVAQTSKLQQVHQETIQTLEDEAIEKEKHAHQSLLQACEAALQACPNKSLGVLMYHIHLLTGNMSLTSLLMAASQLTIKLRDPISSLPVLQYCYYLLLLHTLLGPSGNRDTEPISIPMKVKRGGSSGQTLKGGLPGSLSQGLQPGKMHKADLFQGPLACL